MDHQSHANLARGPSFLSVPSRFWPIKSLLFSGFHQMTLASAPYNWQRRSPFGIFSVSISIFHFDRGRWWIPLDFCLFIPFQWNVHSLNCSILSTFSFISPSKFLNLILSIFCVQTSVIDWRLTAANSMNNQLIHYLNQLKFIPIFFVSVECDFCVGHIKQIPSINHWQVAAGSRHI